jgi:hypothetical protein
MAADQVFASTAFTADRADEAPSELTEPETRARC